MTHGEECLLPKYENLSLDSSTHRKLAMTLHAHTCNPSMLTMLTVAETGGLLVELDVQ